MCTTIFDNLAPPTCLPPSAPFDRVPRASRVAPLASPYSLLSPTLTCHRPPELRNFQKGLRLYYCSRTSIKAQFIYLYCIHSLTVCVFFAGGHQAFSEPFLVLDLAAGSLTLERSRNMF